MGYIFGILDTRAGADNSYLLGPATLGVEVTVEGLAKQCGLGNIDPQHVEGGKSSAVEAALTWPLPSDNTRLVTIRYDKDAVCAMAVLDLRNEGKEDEIDKLLVNWIGILDRMTYPQAAKEHPDLAAMFDRIPTDALNVIIKSRDRRWQYLPGKIRDVCRILTGEMPRKEMAEIAAKREIARREVSNFNTVVERHGPNVAYIYAPGEYEEARNWGNSRFQVTVVFDPQRFTEAGGTQQRWTLVRQPNTFDRQGFEAAINAAEAEARGLSLEELTGERLLWGGNKNIVSSPQGEGYGTNLDKEQILAIVRKHAESGVVS